MRFYMLALAGVMVAGCAHNEPQAVPVAPASQPKTVPAPVVKNVSVSTDAAPVKAEPTFPPVQIGPPPGSSPQLSHDQQLAAVREHQAQLITRRNAIEESQKVVVSQPASSSRSSSFVDSVQEGIEMIGKASSGNAALSFAVTCDDEEYKIKDAADVASSNGNFNRATGLSYAAASMENLATAARARAKELDGELDEQTSRTMRSRLYSSALANARLADRYLN
jgi:hypothetical protein